MSLSTVPTPIAPAKPEPGGKHSASDDEELPSIPDSTSPDEPPAAAVEPWPTIRVSLVILAVLAVLYTMYAAQTLLFPIVLALVLALLFRPPVRRLQRFGIPEAVGAALVVLALLAIVVGAGLRLLGPAGEWMQTMPEHLRQVESRFRALRVPLDEINQASEKVEELAKGGASPLGEPLRVEIQQSTLTGLVLSTTGNILAGTAVTLVLLYFLLALGDRFLNNVVRIMPTFRSKRDVVELVRNVEAGVSAYLFTVSTINVCLGIVIALAMWLLGMPNPLLWGVMATLFNFIPYLGAMVGTGVVFVVAVVTFDSLLFALVIPLVYFGMTALEGSLITPSMLGRSMEMNPILVFLSLVFWGWMWGVGGALLAVPLLAVFKTTCDQFPSTKNLGTLVG